MIGIFYGKWISAGIYLIRDELKFIYHLPFWKREIDLIEYLATKKSTPELKQKTKGKNKKASSFSKGTMNRIRKRWKAILNTFQVKEMEVNIDTDDYIINAYLFPVAQYLGYRIQKPLSINFIGINKVELRIKNRIVNLLYAMLR
ncbi:MAG: hypothetical protein HKN68_20700 [Saprospiraceae bacterium]|nr:hypothetical protein [Saprospiraceae bacterium]